MYLRGAHIWTLLLVFQLVMISGKAIDSLEGGTFLAQGVESLLVGYIRKHGGKAWEAIDSVLLKLQLHKPFLTSVPFSHISEREPYTDSQFSSHSPTPSSSYCQSRREPLVQFWSLSGLPKGPCIEGLFLQTGATKNWAPCKKLGGRRCALGGDSRTAVLSPALCFWAGMR